ncbi:PhzF family phenazine biosynthesis protein [Paraconexibacter algicola]|uniref:Phenazine biosynthesis protein PhzF n=1 Tax=Paraconexibacter algicola TaxID=2133960 RepID=A0A2T4UF88_9ACTN|nr:PhzF family phenazine biosynthesis isomerase [Paraconexibacter algicola]PTL56445.1 phenazine biosynthesis protein PhzF [Paraconexibacter algicola]
MTEILRYAAFTATPTGGNPAGVVLDARGLDEATMRTIATDLGHPETAFVVPGEDGALRVRYFSGGSVSIEVPFCGHATIATAVAHAERHGPGRLDLDTVAGRVVVRTTPGAAGAPPSATLTSVPPRVDLVSRSHLQEALAALRWDPTDLDPRLPPRIADAGARHLVLAALTRARLAALDYDVPRLRAFLEELGLVTVALVHRRRPDGLVFDVRNPFPTGGIHEDPATGAAAAALGGYLREEELVAVPARLTLHQGVDLGRPSLLVVDVPAERGSGIDVTGTAVPIG